MPAVRTVTLSPHHPQTPTPAKHHPHRGRRTQPRLSSPAVTANSGAMLVIGIDTSLAPTVTPRLVSRFGNVQVLFGGLLSATVAYALFLPVASDWTYAAMLPTMLLLGLAFSLAYGPLTLAYGPLT